MRGALLVLTILLLHPFPSRAAPVGTILGSIPAPGPCTTGLTWDGKHLWAADHKTDTLYKLDRKGGKVLARLPSPGYRPTGLAWDGKRLWNADPEAGKLFRLDVGRGVTDRTVEAPARRPAFLAWDGQHLWFGARRYEKLHRLDSLDGTTVDQKKAPSELAGLTHDGRYLWVADRLDDQLHVLHPQSGEVLFSIPSPGPHPTGLAFDGQHLWVADYQTDRIYKVEHRGEAGPVRKETRRQRVELTHQLRNLGPGTLESAQIYLAVPGDSDSQALKGEARFTPKPQRIIKDQWGQRVALFQFKGVGPGKFATVTMTASARLFEVRHRIYPHLLKPLSAVPARLKKRYLVNGAKYDIKHPLIQRTVKEVVGQEKNPYFVARKLYRHVHHQMHYELAGGWNVAPRVLQRGSGSCSEYSFVFISLCRAAGLPARYVGSLVLRKDDASYDDIFHRWVELYLPGHGWVPVDPSRGDKASEVQRADAFGNLQGVFMITTRGGGGSRLLDWGYNSNERWTCRGRCEVKVESIAEWAPAAESRALIR